MRTQLACLLFLASPHAVAAHQRLDTLRPRLEARIAQAPAGATVGLYYRSLSDSDSLLVNAHTRFHAASTMKVRSEEHTSELQSR